MIVVTDATPLHYLILIESDDVLPALFGRIFAPGAVARELSRPATPEPTRRWIATPPGWLTVREPTRPLPPLRLGAGETAAIALAGELGAAWVLIDERRGAREAKGRGLRVAGALGIIEESASRNLIDYWSTRGRLVNDTNVYVSNRVLIESEERYRQRVVSEDRDPDRGAAG